jgi:hypothetical protein
MSRAGPHLVLCFARQGGGERLASPEPGSSPALSSCWWGERAQRSSLKRSAKPAAGAKSGYAWGSPGPKAGAAFAAAGARAEQMLWIDFIRIQPAVDWQGAMAAAKKAERCVFIAILCLAPCGCCRRRGLLFVCGKHVKTTCRQSPGVESRRSFPPSLPPLPSPCPSFSPSLQRGTAQRGDGALNRLLRHMQRHKPSARKPTWRRAHRPQGSEPGAPGSRAPPHHHKPASSGALDMCEQPPRQRCPSRTRRNLWQRPQTVFSCPLHPRGCRPCVRIHVPARRGHRRGERRNVLDDGVGKHRDLFTPLVGILITSGAQRAGGGHGWWRWQQCVQGCGGGAQAEGSVP